MRLFGDYHTHTIYSDGKSTIEENVRSAVNKGLKQIAITDHSFSHMANGISRDGYKEQTETIKELREKYNIDILHGVETNLTSLDGDIDVFPDERKDFDILVLGYHYSYRPLSFKNFFNFWLPCFLGVNTKKRIALNTQAYINAIRKNDIDIVAHLNYRVKVDPVAIAMVAKENNTYIELNTRHAEELSDEQLQAMVKTGVKFIVNTDSHFYENIAKPNRVFAIIEKLKIPTEQIVNMHDLPRFKNYNLDKKY